MTVYFTTHAKVNQLLRHPRNGFDDSSAPTSTFVETLISWIESELETKCNASWRPKTITNEYYDYDLRGYLQLHHANIYQLTSGIDKIEVWDFAGANAYVEFVETYTEGRGEDFWMDYNRGRLFFEDKEPDEGEQRIRMTYRYYTETIPEDIEMATTLLVASLIRDTDDWTPVMSEGGGIERVPQDVIARRWYTRAMNILDHYIRPVHARQSTKVYRYGRRRGFT